MCAFLEFNNNTVGHQGAFYEAEREAGLLRELLGNPNLRAYKGCACHLTNQLASACEKDPKLCEWVKQQMREMGYDQAEVHIGVDYVHSPDTLYAYCMGQSRTGNQMRVYQSKECVLVMQEEHLKDGDMLHQNAVHVRMTRV